MISKDTSEVKRAFMNIDVSIPEWESVYIIKLKSNQTTTQTSKMDSFSLLLISQLSVET